MLMFSYIGNINDWYLLVKKIISFILQKGVATKYNAHKMGKFEHMVSPPYKFHMEKLW